MSKPDAGQQWFEGDNPAERLLRLFTHAKRGDGAQRAVSRWAEVLELPDQQSPVAFLNVANTMLRMTEQITQEVIGLGGRDAEAILRHMPRVEMTIGGFANIFHLTVDEFLRPLGADGFYCLELCSHRLGERWRQVPAPTDQVGAWRKQVKQLLKEVSQATDLPADARIFITKHLLAISVALNEAKFLGWEGVELASDAALGAMAKNPSVMSKLGESKAGAAAAGFLAAVAINVTSNAVSKELLPADQPTPVVIQFVEQHLGAEQFALPPGKTPPETA